MKYLQARSRIHGSADEFLEAFVDSVVICLILEINYNLGNVV